MEAFVTGLHIILCLFLILVVLLQPGKGADFGAMMGGSTANTGSAAQGATLIGKLTAVVAALFMVTSMALAWFSNQGTTSVITDEALEEERAEQESESGSEAGETGDEAEEPGATGDEPAGDVGGGAEAPEGDAAAPEAGEAGEAPAGEGDGSEPGEAPAGEAGEGDGSEGDGSEGASGEGEDPAAQ